MNVPDVAVVNARAYTVDGPTAWAEAVAIRGERIELVGLLTGRLLAAVPPAPAADHARAVATAMHTSTQLESAVTELAAANTG